MADVYSHATHFRPHYPDSWNRAIRQIKAANERFWATNNVSRRGPTEPNSKEMVLLQEVANDEATLGMLAAQAVPNTHTAEGITLDAQLLIDNLDIVIEEMARVDQWDVSHARVESGPMRDKPGFHIDSGINTQNQDPRGCAIVSYSPGKATAYLEGVADHTYMLVSQMPHNHGSQSWSGNGYSEWLIANAQKLKLIPKDHSIINGERVDPSDGSVVVMMADSTLHTRPWSTSGPHIDREQLAMVVSFERVATNIARRIAERNFGPDLGR